MTQPVDTDFDIRMVPSSFQEIRVLDEGGAIDETPILHMCEFVDRRLDCADFKMATLLRTMYAYSALLSDATVRRIRDTILHFKYWIDEPGEDSMCYWTENHQILFAVAEYLAGQLYPDERFANSGMTGTAHMEKARVRVERWLRHRFQYGFSEWHSNTYYEEDIAPLAVFIDFCADEQLVTKAKMVLDLMLLDMAIHSYRGLFGAASGRCYEAQKKRPLYQSTLIISEHVWRFGHVREFDYRKISANFVLSRKYDLPEVIRLIGRDNREVVIKDSMGLDLDEVDAEFPGRGNAGADAGMQAGVKAGMKAGTKAETKGLFLWGMGSLVNTRSVQLTMALFRRWNLQRNAFLRPLGRFNHPLLVKTGLLPLIVRLLNPQPQGLAMQRANCYTFKTGSYMMSTVQRYHPGKFSFQQHVWQATLSNQVTVFTTHPAVTNPEFRRSNNASPGYWIGNGLLPDAAQDRNVHMSIYNLHPRRGMMEQKRMLYTHAYFPWDQFDEVMHDGVYLFGKLGSTYVALIGKQPLRPSAEDRCDILQEGKLTCWICELAVEEDWGSFQAYADSVRSREIGYKNGTWTYRSDKLYELKYKGDFRIDGVPVSTNYDRLDTPYVTAGRKPEEISVHFQGKQLKLHFEKGIREHKDHPG